jgi:hypothetical protein
MHTEYLNFCPRLKKIIDSGQSIDKSGKVVPVAGVSTLNNLRVIREMMLSHGWSRTLEVGLAYGGSALTFLATSKASGKGDRHHTAIDPFQNSHWGGSALQVIEEEGFSGDFTHCEDFSSIALPELVGKKEKYQLIYIDGSHLFEDVLIDFYYSAMLLECGGCLLFDDCTDKHVKKVIRFIRSNYSDILEEIDLRPFEDPDKSLKKRIGNSLGIRQMSGFKKLTEPPRKWDAPLGNF